MIEKVGSITELEWAESNKGTKYLKATIKGNDEKDNHFNVFDPNIQETLSEAFEQGFWVNYKIDKKGNFWNITEAKKVADALEDALEKKTPSQSTPKIPTPQKETTPEMTPDKWTEKDRITRKSIERQTSLNAAVELAKVGIIKPDQVLPSARKFEEYLEGKEVQPAKHLVEAAKKMGATEIKEGEN